VKSTDASFQTPDTQHHTPTFRLGGDIGGTFTDLILLASNGRCWRKKVPSTTEDYSRGIAEGLRVLLADEGLDGVVEEVVHGTTVATNAILEGRGARTALLTTCGFRDVLEFRRLRVPQLYDLFYSPPAPLVERRLRLEVDERMGPRGEVVKPLDEASVRVTLERIRSEGAEAVAICLLHSYVNPAHERRVGKIVRDTLPDVFLALSVDVLPEIREYERTSTTVINAYVGPVVKSYLNSLETRLEAAGHRAHLRIMQSNGGIMSARAAAEKPAHIVESGPAAGVIAGQRLGERLGLPNLITFDMGGTTAKASLIEDGQVSRTTEYEVGAGISLSSRLIKGGGHALKLPVVDVAEVGAGGGSIVWIDRAGRLQVGPRSAGALPGPACYGTGGTEPTITDANVVLGYSNPYHLAGGAVQLHADLAEAAFARSIATPLGLPLLEAVHGAFSVANATMIRAIKAVSTYRGRDPRDFALLAFGGNGPVHAAAIAGALEIRQVVVPPVPGLFSAIGLLEAQPEQHFVRTFIQRIQVIDLVALDKEYQRLETLAGDALRDDGYSGSATTFERLADLRYAGQAYELTVSAPTEAFAPADLLALAESFEREHERTYGHRAKGEPVEIVNLRLVARVALGQTSILRFPDVATRQPTERRVYFGPEHGSRSTPIIARSDLDRSPRNGPLIVEEYDATVVIPPDCSAWLDELGNIRIDLRWTS
jgi:N-methylhydantoinase A